MSAHVLEGHIRVEEYGCGGSDIYLGDKNVAEWAQEVIPGDDRETVKAVLMIEDAVCLEAQGRLHAWEGEAGYSSWTPGSGPSVEVWQDSKYHDFAEKLEQHDGCNAALSLEAIA